jgi:hypothetical protein
MLYTSTKTLLRTIVASLETANDGAWDDQIESGKECLYEMYQMARPGVASAVDRLAVEKLARAIPHVKLMLGSIRRRNRQAALNSGRAAIAEL